jgi:hypothetical protein
MAAVHLLEAFLRARKEREQAAANGAAEASPPDPTPRADTPAQPG